MVDEELDQCCELHGSLRVMPPKDLRESMFKAHGGIFGPHLSDRKVYSKLSRHYWWPKMRSDVTKWTHSCLVYVNTVEDSILHHILRLR